MKGPNQHTTKVPKTISFAYKKYQQASRAIRQLHAQWKQERSKIHEDPNVAQAFESFVKRGIVEPQYEVRFHDLARLELKIDRASESFMTAKRELFRVAEPYPAFFRLLQSKDTEQRYSKAVAFQDDVCPTQANVNVMQVKALLKNFF